MIPSRTGADRRNRRPGMGSAAGATVERSSPPRRGRELARGGWPDASPDVEKVVDMECAVASALAWAPAAHCKALRSLSARLEAGQHWVEAAEAAATAAGVTVQALAARGHGEEPRRRRRPAKPNVPASSSSTTSTSCVWSGGRAFARGRVRVARRRRPSLSRLRRRRRGSARCGRGEISEEKVLAHLAEAVRLFVKGGHLEAAVRAAKVALPAWERRRALGFSASARRRRRYLSLVAPAPSPGRGGRGNVRDIYPRPRDRPRRPPFYRVRLVGSAWERDRESTWVHREPRSNPRRHARAPSRVTRRRAPEEPRPRRSRPARQ